MSKREFRFVTARGVEQREIWSSIWTQVMPVNLAAMTADELRAVADAMDAAQLPQPPREDEAGE